MEKKLRSMYPDANITVKPSNRNSIDIEAGQYKQAQRERKWISDDELH